VIKCSPKAKILLYIFLVVAVFISRSFQVSLILLFVVIALATRVPLSKFRSGLIPIAFFLLFTFLSNAFFHEGIIQYKILGLSITDEGIKRGGELTLRLFILIIGARILTVTTRAEDLVKAMSGLLGPVGRLGFVKEVIVTMSLTLRLLPIIYNEASELYKNVKKSETKGLAGKIRLSVSLLTPLFENSLKKAKEMTNMEKEFEF